MRHFAEARQEVAKHFQADSGIRRRLERICLIWDLQGRLRVLLKLARGEDPGSIRSEIEPKMEALASPFWTGDVWMWLPESPGADRAVYELAWTEARMLDPGPPEMRVLERHLSKGAWFGSRVEVPWPLNDSTPPILSFYSFKGGVGRTTGLLSLAIQLARSGRRVAVVDLDLEAPGVMSALVPPDGIQPSCGVLDYMLERPLVNSGDDFSLADFYYVVDDRRVIMDGVPLTVVPSGRLDTHYLQKLARLDYERLYALSSGTAGHPSPLVDLLKSLRGQLKADYLLLDSRAGFNDMGGLALSGISHLDVIFGLNSEQSWNGLELVVRFLGRDRVESDLPQLECLLVHAMAPEPGPGREVAVAEFQEKAYDLFSEEYYDEEGSEGEWPLPAPDAAEQPHYPVVLGFDPRVQRYRSITDVVNHLVEGDFRTFAEQVLARIGRSLI